MGAWLPQITSCSGKSRYEGGGNNFPCEKAEGIWDESAPILLLQCTRHMLDKQMGSHRVASVGPIV